jgi:dipeptidyl-peptidase-4
VLTLGDGNLKTLFADQEGWHTLSLGPDCRFGVHQFSQLGVPPIWNLVDSEGQTIQSLQSNQPWLDRLAKFGLQKPQWVQIPGNDGVVLNGWLLRPLGGALQEPAPVLMFCYGGPGHQQVRNEYDPFNYYWFQHLAAHGYGVLWVDNRGTGGRGAAFKKSTYLNLGQLEWRDQTAAAEWLRQQSWVNRDRIGIWGWSFGGYLSSLCITKSPDVFRAAIAVAPVTNWRFYDTIYTERFLRKPQENPKGYDDNSPIQFAKGLQGRYLLVHGTADDNVHVQNAYEMSNALVMANKPFDQFIYPDRNHGIYGGPTRLHLYRQMTQWLNANL